MIHASGEGWGSEFVLSFRTERMYTISLRQNGDSKTLHALKLKGSRNPSEAGGRLVLVHEICQPQE